MRSFQCRIRIVAVERQNVFANICAKYDAQYERNDDVWCDDTQYESQTKEVYHTNKNWEKFEFFVACGKYALVAVEISVINERFTFDND